MVSKGSRALPTGQSRAALTQPAYLGDNARMQTRKRQLPFASLGKQGLSSTMFLVLTLYQKIHRQQMHPLNRMQVPLIPHRWTGTMSLRNPQDGLPKGHERSVILLDLYGIYLVHCL